MDDQVTIDDVYDRVRQGEWSLDDFKDWVYDNFEEKNNVTHKMKTPTPINNDLTRCYGDRCEIKESCHRFLTIAIDPVRVLYYATRLHQEKDAECDDYMEFKR